LLQGLFFTCGLGSNASFYEEIGRALERHQENTLLQTFGLDLLQNVLDAM
jgi:hypothetical protein